MVSVSFGSTYKINSGSDFRTQSKIVDFCMDNNIDIVVFNMSDTNNLIRVINGEKIGTTIRKEF